MFSCSKYRSSFISRSVRKQNIECSNGVIFLIATLCPDGLCNAELSMASATTQILNILDALYQTTPYAPSPTISWISYCSDTLNVILREPEGTVRDIF